MVRWGAVGADVGQSSPCAQVRKDPNLAALREDERFKRIIDAYDEPIINEGAIKALKSIFSFGKE